jgi:hypothetical protein
MALWIPLATIIAAALISLGLAIRFWPSSRKKEIEKLGRLLAEQAIAELGDALGSSVRESLRIEPLATHSLVRRKLKFRRVEKLIFRVTYTGSDAMSIREHVEARIGSYFRRLRRPRFRYGFAHDTPQTRRKRR